MQARRDEQCSGRPGCLAAASALAESSRPAVYVPRCAAPGDGCAAQLRPEAAAPWPSSMVRNRSCSRRFSERTYSGMHCVTQLRDA